MSATAQHNAANAAPGDNETKPKGVIAKLLGVTLIVLVGLLLLLSVALTLLWTVTATERGSQWLLNRLLPSLQPMLQVEGVSGTLWRGLALERLVFVQEGIRVEVTGFASAWDPLSPLGGELRILQLNAEIVEVALTPSPNTLPKPQPKKPQIAPWPSLSVPFPLRLEQLRVDRLNIVSAGQTHRVAPLTLGVAVGPLHTRIGELALVYANQGSEIGLNLTGRLRNSAPYAMTLDLDWRAALAAGDFLGRAKFSGDLSRLNISHTVTAPYGVADKDQTLLTQQKAAQTEISSEILLTQPFDRKQLVIDINQLKIDSSHRWQELAVPIGAERTLVSGGELKFSGTLKDYRLDADAVLDVISPVEQWLPMQLSASVNGDTEGVQIKELSLANEQASISSQGKIAWQPELSWQLQLAVADFNPGMFASAWPGRVNAQINSEGVLTANDPELFERVDALLDITRLSGQLRQLPLNGTGTVRFDQGEVNVSGLNFQLADNSLELQATINKQVQAQWQLQASDLAQLMPGLRGSLQLQGSAQGPREQPRINAELVAKDLGYYSGVNNPGSKTASAGNTATIQSSGQSVAQVKRLTLQLATGADAETPVANANAIISAQGSPSPGSATQASTIPTQASSTAGYRLTLQASGIEAAGLSDAQMELQLDGDLGAHRFALGLAAAGNRVDLAGTGALNTPKPDASSKSSTANTTTRSSSQTSTQLSSQPSPQWRAELERATFSIVQAGEWQLQEAAVLQIGEARYYLAPSCWQTAATNVAGKLCAELDYSQQQLHLEANLAQLPLAILAPWLPAGVHIDSHLHGNLKAEGTPAAPNINAEFRADPGILSFKPVTDADSQRSAEKQNDDAENMESIERIESPESSDTEAEQFAFDQLYLNLRQQDAGWYAESKLGLPQRGNVEVELNLTALTSDAAVTGAVNINLQDLAWIDLFVPTLADLQGHLAAQLDISGFLAQPRAAGQLSLQELRVQLPELGVALSDGNIALRSQAADTSAASGNWNVQGQVRSRAISNPAVQPGPETGVLRLGGDFKLNSLTDWQAQLNLEGRQVALLDLPDRQVSASPNLNLKLRPDQLDIKGEVEIPSANIKLTSLPATAVSVSTDEVLVNQPEATESNAAYTVSSDIQLRLGDRVAFSGFGLKGRLQGDLRLTESPQQPLRIEGVISIEEGIYKAYGQNLTIEQGRLIFQGPPQNPGLDVRAVRRAGDVTAGIIIGGTAKRLDSEIFSEPPQSPSEAMAILLTGKSLDSASEAEANLMLNAVTKLGISQSKFITSRLQQTFGLDVLSLGGDEGFESSALIVGKYLSPRLFVSYSKDLFTPAGEVELDYRLSDRIKVKAASGENQSMDLIYSLER